MIAERTAADWIYDLMIQPRYNPDGVVEPLWVSEMGTYYLDYDDPSVASDLADSVFALNTLDQTVDKGGPLTRKT